MERIRFCARRAIRMAPIGLVALFAVAPGTKAQEPFPTLKTRVSLVQKFQPVSPSYPGVSADMLGIRIGMSVAEAEAVAEKSYGRGTPKPFVSRSSDWFIYGPGNFTIKSRPFISRVSLNRQAGIMSESLGLHFSSPVTGNTLLGMSRQISYYQGSNQKTPPISTIEALLIKKYGPTSYQSMAQDGGLKIGWIFGQKTLFICKTSDCMGGPSFSCPPPANATTGFPNIFRIDAKIDAKKSAKTEVSDVTVSIWDAAACMNDAQEAKKQLAAAAIEYWKATYKPPAGPAL